MPTYAKRVNPKQRPPRPSAPADTTRPRLLKQAEADSMPIFRSKKKIKPPTAAEIQDMERQEFIRKNKFTNA